MIPSRSNLRLALALVAGAASALAFSPFDLFPLPILTLGVLFHFWRGARVGQTVALGFAFGLGLFGAGVSWVYVSLHTYGGMPVAAAVAATLGFCAYLALYPALAGWVFAKLRTQRTLPDALLAAAAWTLAEWLRGWVFTGFPWLAIGYSQTPPSPLAGFAPVLGVYGVSLAVALAAALISVAPRVRAAVAVAALLASGGALSLIHWTQPAPSVLSVSLIQTNIEQGLKWRPELLPQFLAEHLDLVAAHPARLIVLPETTLPVLTEQLPENYLANLSEQARRAGGEVVLGAFTRNERGQIFNSALLLGPERVQHYAKAHLVPFGEFSPPLFGWVYQLLDMPMSDQTRGAATQPPLRVGAEKIAVNICYEDVFGEELLPAAREATLLLNLSNLAWYGESFAQPQHLQIAQMRALETGRPMLRSTNTGMTAVIEPDGRVRAVLPAFTRGALQTVVRGTVGATPYLRLGNAPLVWLVGLLLGMALLLRGSKVTVHPESELAGLDGRR